MRTVPVRALVACGAVVALTLRAEGQVPDTGSRPEVLLRRDVALAIPQLNRTISVRFEGAPLDEALRTVARQADLPLTYNDAILPRHVRVWLAATEIRTDEALEQILRDSGLQLLPLSTGQVVVVKAQNGSVSGRVSEAKTGLAIAGASVTIAGTRWHATTGEDGRFRLEDVAAGTYSLTVRRIGYVTGSASVTVVAGQGTTVELRLDVSASPLDAVVVTGTVSAAEVKEIPNPITLITAAQIEQRGITQINQLFRGDIPGMFTADQGENSTEYGAPVFVRGTTQLFGTPALKTYIDGIEIVNSQFINEIDPSMIDHIEIVRGPEAATLYGAQAINGVMQIFTKKGQLATAPRVTASLGLGTIESPFATADHQEDQFGVMGGTGDLSYNVGASYEHEGAWTRDHHLNAYSSYGSLAIRPARSPFDVSVTARLGQRNTQIGGGEGEYQDVLNGSIRLGSWAFPLSYRITQPQRTLGVSVNYAPHPSWRQSFTVGIDHGGDGSFAADGKLQPVFTSPGDSLAKVFSTHSTRLTAAYNNAVDLRLTDKVTTNLTIGADYWNYRSDFRYDDGQPADSIVKQDRDHNTGVFGQARLGLADALFLTAGLRVDYGPTLPADRHHRVAVPRVGASYAFGRGTLRAKARLEYGSALRPALPDEKRFIQFQGGFVQLASPNLRPERQRGWDAGVDLYAGDRASLTITHYRQTASDLIYFVFPSDTSQQYLNLDRVRNSGWEFEGTLRLVTGLSARATYSEVESVIEALDPNDISGFSVGQTLPGVPHHTGALTLSAVSGGLSVEGGVSYVGTSVNIIDPRVLTQLCFVPRLPTNCDGSLLQPVARVPAAYRFALRAGYDITPRLSLFVRSENLTNKIVDDSRLLTADRFGRTTMFGLRVK